MHGVPINEFRRHLAGGPWKVVQNDSCNGIIVDDSDRFVIITIPKSETKWMRGHLRWSLSSKTDDLAVVNAFQNRRELAIELPVIEWNTSAWIVEEPDHIIHFGRIPFFRLRAKIDAQRFS